MTTVIVHSKNSLTEDYQEITIPTCLLIDQSQHVTLHTGLCTDATSCDQAAFDQFVWVMTHDLTIFTRARLPLVSIHDEVAWPTTDQIYLQTRKLCHVRGCKVKRFI